jgi:hypothetical protein
LRATDVNAEGILRLRVGDVEGGEDEVVATFGDISARGRTAGAVGSANRSCFPQMQNYRQVTASVPGRAERTGFEPAVGFNPYTGLANRRYRPLSHLSKIFLFKGLRLFFHPAVFPFTTTPTTVV